MKAGGFYAAVAVLAVLGGLVWWTNKHPVTPKTTTPAATKLISTDPGQIEQIRIAKPGSDPVVLKKVSDIWQITAPKALAADSEAVGPLTGALSSIDTDRMIDEHPASLDPYGLNATATEIDITAKGGKTTKLLIGSATPSGSDNYAKLESDPKVYTIASSVKTGFDKGLDDLRDKRLLSFNQNKLTSLTLAAKGPEIQFAKKDGEWQIVKPKPMRADGLQVDDLVRKLLDMRMDLSGNYDPKDAATKFAAGSKIASATATDDRGTQSVEVRKSKDDYYAKSSVVDGVYKIASDIADGLNKSAEDYRNKKVFDFGFNDVSKLEINGQTYDKTGDKWSASGGVQFDSNSIQDVVDKLRDLAATKFSEKMGGTKTLTLAATAGDNHRREQVTINKDGDLYDAQRADDPTVYVLDAKSVDDLQKAISGIKQYQPPKADGGKKK
jgi:hypothetical protein